MNRIDYRDDALLVCDSQDAKLAFAQAPLSRILRTEVEGYLLKTWLKSFVVSPSAHDFIFSKKLIKYDFKILRHHNCPIMTKYLRQARRKGREVYKLLV